VRPNPGAKFKVEEAEKWRSKLDVREVIYVGEVGQVSNSYSKDGVEVGTLVFIRSKELYVIKVSDNQIYWCLPGKYDFWYWVIIIVSKELFM